MNVLIVDDSLSDRELVRIGLEAKGVVVSEAADGAEGLERLQTEHFDAVITDILMPRMDGNRFCRAIRRDARICDLPIIARTGAYVSETDAKLAVLNGADRFFPKSGPPGDLFAVLVELLASRPVRRPPAAAPEDPLVMVEYNSELVRKLEETTRELAERNEQLGFANEQLRALTVRNDAVRESERTTIAREIHDVLAQGLTCLKIDLAWLGKQLAKPIDEPARGMMVARVEDAIAQTDAAISSVQHIATELRPVVLDSLGLSAAVEWQAGDFARRSGLTLRAVYPPEQSALGREGATAVFRVLQECLTNIARHARATEFEVRLAEDQGGASLTVADNGRGITVQQITAARSLGLVGMRERAQACGGTVEITGAPGAGTTVRIRIPFETAPP